MTLFESPSVRVWFEDVDIRQAELSLFRFL